MKVLFLLGALFYATNAQYWYMYGPSKAMRIVSDSMNCEKGRLEFYQSGTGWGAFARCGTNSFDFSSSDADHVCTGLGFDEADPTVNFNGYVLGTTNYAGSAMFPDATQQTFDEMVCLSSSSANGNTCKNCSVTDNDFCSGTPLATVNLNSVIHMTGCRACSIGIIGQTSCTGGTWSTRSRWDTRNGGSLLCAGVASSATALATSTTGQTDCTSLYSVSNAIAAAVAAIGTAIIILIVVLSVCCLIIIIAICACVFGGVACCAAAASSPNTM